jgi:hypothetical protein
MQTAFHTTKPIVTHSNLYFKASTLLLVENKRNFLHQATTTTRSFTSINNTNNHRILNKSSGSIQMNKLKTFKNYLSSSPSGANSDPEISATNNSSNRADSTTSSETNPEQIQPSSSETTQSRTAKLTKSINESTKRFSNLLQFNRNGGKNSEDDQQTNAASSAACDIAGGGGGELKRANRAKFLRSNTLASLRSSTRKKLSPNEEQLLSGGTTNLSKKQVLQNDDLLPESIFATLHSDIDRLIKHFEEQAPHQQQQQAQHDYTYFMETTDVTPGVYLSLLRHTKEVVSSTLVIYNQV